MSDPGPAEVAPRDLAARVLARAAVDRAGPLIALDHDGVISPIAPTPDAAVLLPATAVALAGLAARTPVTVLSGRGLDDLVARLGGLPLTLVAEHGLRARLADGTVIPLAEGVAPATLDRLRTALARTLTGRQGWIVEDKGVGLAVHHRLADPDDVTATLPRVRELLAGAAEEGGGQVQDGHAVVELRSAHADKGTALRWVAGRHPGRTVVMVGDDLTDEPAFAAAQDLGGSGVLVAEAARPSAAGARIPDPSAVAELLAAIAQGLPLPATQGSRAEPLSPGR